MSTAFTRRDFLKAGAAAGAGLTIAITLPGCNRTPSQPATDAPFAPNAWLRIRPDGSVTIVVDRSEMGQGVTTALPMLVAEELDADWSMVRFERAPAGAAYANAMMRGMQGTGGSTSVRNAWVPLREAGARARLMLIAAAARQWNVDPATCRTSQGVVHHDATDRRATYGELADLAGQLPVPEKVTLRDPREFRLIGKAVPRLDSPAIVTGEPVFAIDVAVPGMLTAVVARCPVFGGKLKSFDPAPALAVPGVRHVVAISSGVAVVADGFWAAKKGRDALVVMWDEGPLATLSSAEITERFKTLAAGEAPVVRSDGDVDAALARAPRTLEAIYELPYLAHATMEPMTCAADVKPDSCTVWAPTQIQWAPRMLGGGAHGLAARLSGLPRDRVTVHTTQLGGGFGRRAEMDFVAEAVETSKAVGAPVKVIWTREDDIRHDFYRPASYHVMRGAVNEAGAAVAWKHRIVVPSILARFMPGWLPEWLANRMGLLEHGVDPTSIEGAVGTPYAVPALEVSCARADVGVPVGFWRSVGNTHTAFACESFVDELAHLAGADPYYFRRELLKGSPRHLGVLDLAAEKAGWGTPLPPGRARGIAVHESFGTWVAQVAEVSLNPDGTPRVHRVVSAVDCGIVINPDTVRAQIEGAMVYGLTAALFGEVAIENGRARPSNFHDYPMLRMNQMPAVETYLVSSTADPGGVGEPGTPPIAPAVANALFALTGVRVRRLPIAALTLP
ncbi:MAG: molybdopterin cofactor-binding domain-containing protein [Gemmatimonadota bacterium]